MKILIAVVFIVSIVAVGIIIYAFHSYLASVQPGLVNPAVIYAMTLGLVWTIISIFKIAEELG